MISVIVCSIKPELLAHIEKNIAETMGCAYEIIVRDNRGTDDGICRVYNQLAEQAKYDNLCFVHEDVKFVTQNWGKILCVKAAETQTGIIGFAGCAMKSRTLSGAYHKHYMEHGVTESEFGNADPQIRTHVRNHNVDDDFVPVITIDGVFLFMRKEVWQENRFDEDIFRGFHLYDLDISTAVSLKYTNYVCHSIDIIHYSSGAYSKTWYDETVKYHKKWSGFLPLYVEKPDAKQIARDEQDIFPRITYHLIKHKVLPPSEVWSRIVEDLKKNPFKFKSYYMLYRFLRYKLEYPNN